MIGRTEETMYVPPLDAILRNIGTTYEEFSSITTVTIPSSLFRFLLQLALINGDFNEEGYLSANPDIGEAVRRGTITSPRLHYIGTGYFENRAGGSPRVDERWYRSRFPDVAAAIQANEVGSAANHFSAVGAGELRAPSGMYELDAVEWGKAIRKG